MAELREEMALLEHKVAEEARLAKLEEEKRIAEEEKKRREEEEQQQVEEVGVGEGGGFGEAGSRGEGDLRDRWFFPDGAWGRMDG